MPSVMLSLDEATRPDLPLVCVRCGARALSFRRLPLVGWWLGPIQAPFCMNHHDHWRWRAAVVVLGFLVIGIALVPTLGLALEELTDGVRGHALLAMGVLALLLWVMVMLSLALYFTAVRVSHVGADSLTLSGVAPAFIEALREHREAPGPETPRSTWAFPNVPPDPSRRLNAAARAALDLARQEARRRWKADHLGTAHLLYGLSAARTGEAAHVLHNLGITPDRIRAVLDRQSDASPETEYEGPLPWTPAVKRVVENAVADAGRTACADADESHLLMALLQETEGEAVQLLLALGVEPDEVRQKARWLLRPHEGIQASGADAPRHQIQSAHQQPQSPPGAGGDNPPESTNP